MATRNFAIRLSLQDILREILRTQRESAGGLFGELGGIIINGLGSLFSGGRGRFVAPGAHLSGFAHGGSFTVGGGGGPDSQLVAFRTRPGERVSVATPAQPAGGIKVIINNHSRAEVSARESAAPGGGVSLDITIGDAMVRQVRRSGSQTSRALIDTFGAQRALATR